MNCATCKNGQGVPGTVTVSLTRGETLVVIRGVPASVCENCGDYTLEAGIAQRVDDLANDAVAHRAEVEILRYAA
ncbi:type II toxin-antitoxin system MqsA family antitoxin [Thiococcus pfennigii]|uniref:type II toxin-antitoxin system MqsA family antitoxin n=1 Tax=Thiococcus pfennigii TaxID=1057 RepID=UPI0019049B31|nr:type II toxin-antitoxin system MqsA family antitoxin [Thiococcus pfennigii]MBK1733576.1 hypothetical protein [Thiococcus pfennigii]